jgi:hypothetical protein
MELTTNHLKNKNPLLEGIGDKKILVSLYQNFITNVGSQNIYDLLQDIKAEKYQSDINSIRYALQKGDTKKADQIKVGLPAFTTSATFKGARVQSNMTSYSQLICLDFDHIPAANFATIISNINNNPFTLSSFVSPSGDGIKVIVKVNSDAFLHSFTYKEVASYYKGIINFDCDPKCKDITRLCFLSSDSDCHINENAIIFDAHKSKKQDKNIDNKLQIQNINADVLLDNCLKFTEQKEHYYNGNRNNFIFQFACNANKYGITQNDTLTFCTNNFDLDESEIKSTISTVYKNKGVEFASFAKFANLQSSKSSNENEGKNTFDEYEDILKTTPLIPQSVYDNLPPILLESCKVFLQPRERDTFLTGALAILSGCLPNVSGVYSGSLIYPSLFSFILAPAASGKGALKYAKTLADKFHQKTLMHSIEEKKQYAEHLQAYNLLKTKGKLEPNQEPPQASKFKVVFIPANTSNAKIIQHLDENNGKGIICETEADTLGQTFKNDWGSYSDMLRKSFHHEKISISRKTEGEYVEVNEPQLSVALSGTPKQVFNIITSAEDGLFSRFIFYIFKTDAVWYDPSPKGNPVNLTTFFDNQSKEVLKMVEFYENDEMILHLTDIQWQKLNHTFKEFLEKVNTFVSDDALSIVKRLGLILYRFCMIFTAIRKFATNEYHKEVFCSDIDFESATTLVSVYLQHSIIMFNNLPKQDEKGVFKTSQNKELFLESLPRNFSRKNAVELGKNFSMSERTVDSFLKICLGKYLVQPKTGHYEKIVS